jgi:hypothetical protein
VGLLVVATAGCGLVSSDGATTVPVDLPDKMFTVDTASWQIPDGKAVSYLATSCTSAGDLCEAAAELACAAGCSGECDADTHTCDLSLDVSLYEAIDVGTEQPAVATVGDATSVQITIDHVTYDVTTNSLDLDTPELTVYVAPASVTAPGPMATAVGTIAPIHAGDTLTAQELVFTATGQADLSAAMSSYETPFNIIIGSTLVLHAGDPAPTGKLAARLHIAAHAGL